MDFKFKERDFNVVIEKDDIKGTYNVLSVVFDALLTSNIIKDLAVPEATLKQADTLYRYDDAFTPRALTATNLKLDRRYTAKMLLNAGKNVNSLFKEMQVDLVHLVKDDSNTMVPNLLQYCTVLKTYSGLPIAYRLNYINSSLSAVESSDQLKNCTSCMNEIGVMLFGNWVRAMSTRFKDSFFSELAMTYDENKCSPDSISEGYVSTFKNPLLAITCFNTRALDLEHLELKNIEQSFEVLNINNAVELEETGELPETVLAVAARISKAIGNKSKLGFIIAPRLAMMYGVTMQILTPNRTKKRECYIDDGVLSKYKVRINKDGNFLIDESSSKKMSLAALQDIKNQTMFFGMIENNLFFYHRSNNYDFSEVLMLHSHLIEYSIAFYDVSGELVKYKEVTERQEERVNKLSSTVKELEGQLSKLQAEPDTSKEDYDADKLFNSLTDTIAELEMKVDKLQRKVSKQAELLGDAAVEVDDEDVEEASVQPVSIYEQIEEIKKHSIVLITGMTIPRITEELGIEQKIVNKTANISNLIAKDNKSEYIGIYTRKIGHRCVSRVEAVTKIQKSTFFMLNNTNFSIIVNYLYDLIVNNRPEHKS